MKIGVAGAGNVGSACLLSLIMRGVESEIVVVHRPRAPPGIFGHHRRLMQANEGADE